MNRYGDKITLIELNNETVLICGGRNWNILYDFDLVNVIGVKSWILSHY